MGVLEITNVWKVLLGDQTLARAVVLALTKPLPWAQYMIVISSLLTHGVSKMSLHFLFFHSPRLPWKYGVIPLLLGSATPPRMFIFPSWIVPSWILSGEHLNLPSGLIDRYSHSSKVLFWAESSSPVPSWCSMWLWLNWWSYSCCTLI